MARHTGTCQHVAHPKDSHRKERRNSTGPIRSGGNRAPGFIELEETKATPKENASVRPCLNCAVPKRGRMTADEAKHWPTKGPSQMEQAFNRAFYAYSSGLRTYHKQPHGNPSVREGRREWMLAAQRLQDAKETRRRAVA
jgi:hypothetical protein